MKASTVIIQTADVVKWMGAVGPREYAQAFLEVYGANPMMWFGKGRQSFQQIARDSTSLHMRMTHAGNREIENAIATFNAPVQSFGRAALLRHQLTQPIQHVFLPIAMMDVAVSLPGWKAAYNNATSGRVENVDANAPDLHEQAVAYADRTVIDTQGSGLLTDLSAIQRGPEVFKTFMMFMSYGNTVFNQMARIADQVRLGQFKDAAKASFYYILAITALEETIRRSWPESDEDGDGDTFDDAAAHFGKKVLKNALNTVPLARDIQSKTEFRFGQINPAFDILVNAGRGAAGIADRTADLISGNEIKSPNKQERREMLDAAGLIMGGLPTSQILITYDGIKAWENGRPPGGFFEAVDQVLIKGPPKK